MSTLLPSNCRRLFQALVFLTLWLMCGGHCCF
jgi:hypothetical protein